jgi:cation/acetate symporter
MALSTITVSTFYLTAQMVGGGVLVKTLIGIDYEISVIAVGVLMLAYVVFGGMVATTYVQIVKAILLVIASLVMVRSSGAVRLQPAGIPHGRGERSQHPGAGRRDARRRLAQHEPHGARPALPRAGAPLQESDRPGLARHGPRAWHRGPAPHPHALLHGPTAQAARKSVIWAMAIIGGFYVLTLFLGSARR